LKDTSDSPFLLRFCNLQKRCYTNKIIGGGTPKTNNPNYWNCDIPWISVIDFSDGRKYIHDTDKKITQQGLQNSSTKILHKGQIIISARGTVGELAVLTRDMAFNQTSYGLNAKSVTCNEFLYYLLLFSMRQIRKKTHGSVFDTITKETFKQIHVNLPPLPEQRAIAEVLSSLDDKIELNRRMNQTLEQLAQAIYKHMFIDNPEREGWGTKRLGEIADVNWGDTNTTKASYVTDGFIAFSAKGPDGYLPYYDFNVTGVVLSAIGANSGMTWLAQGKWSCIKNTIRFWSTSEEVSTEYLFMATFGNEKWPLRGSAQPFISQTDARNMLINVPEKGLAKKFGDIVNPFYSQIDQNVKQNNVLAELRDTLLPKLMSGQVRVHGGFSGN
jgi:type I restriction enzyme S subunit